MPRYSAVPGLSGILLPSEYRVFLDGADISDVACVADTGEGWADVYPHEFIDGRLHLSSAKPERRYGKVEIRKTTENP